MRLGHKSPSLSIVFGLSSKTQWLSGLYCADFISCYSPTQLCGGGTTKSNSNELPISVPLFISYKSSLYRLAQKVRQSRGTGKRLDFSRYVQWQEAVGRHLERSLKPLLRVSFQCLGAGDLAVPKGPAQK